MSHLAHLPPLASWGFVIVILGGLLLLGYSLATSAKRNDRELGRPQAVVDVDGHRWHFDPMLGAYRLTDRPYIALTLDQIERKYGPVWIVD